MRRVLTVVAAALLISGPAFAGEDELTPQQAHDLARVWMQVHGDLVALGGLSESDATFLAEEIDAYLNSSGRREHLRAMLRETKATGCRSECVKEAFKAMNRSMAVGLRDHEAGKLVAEALREQQREREQKQVQLTNKQMADQLRDRTQQRIAARVRNQKQGVGGSGLAGQTE